MKKYSPSEIDQIINSIEGIQRATASSFFYNGVRSKMEQQMQATKSNWWGQYKPVMVAAIFFAFLLINSFILLQQPIQSTGNNETAINSVEDFSKEYNLNSSVDF